MPEAPETPAPVFAIRAFKSALFGTPGAEDEGDGERTFELKKQRDGHQQSRSLTDDAKDGGNTKMTDSDAAANATNANASPTKSILLTPGTASNRRKTVSFGDGVVDNERKRDTSSSKPSKTPPSSTGSISSQWLSGSSEGRKPRSKLTQTLLDARDKSPEEAGSSFPKAGQNSPPESAPRTMAPAEEDDNDYTVNLNEPRSESGKYWKAEFDSYRTKTSDEIKRLIQYRSVAKSFARKKDEEALRLTDKLRDEEKRVSEMERHVSKLASTMVGTGAKADKEQLVQDLTKQTALALQYKHRVSLLRKLLEKHGVVGSEVDDIGEHAEVDSPSEKTAGELRRTQQALEHANTKFEDQRREFSKLRSLAHSSEEKASKLEGENMSLKHTLARVKQEMNKFEGRRLEKEGKLKQREAKLEARVKECRERLKRASKEHRSREQELHAEFDEERCRMREEIHHLRMKLRNAEHLEGARTAARYRHHPNTTHQNAELRPSRYYFSNSETDESDEPPSPSPRSKEREMQYFREPAEYSEGAAELNSSEDDEDLSPSEAAHAEQHLRSRSVANSDAQYRPQHFNRANTDSDAAYGKQKYATDHRRHSQHRSQTNRSAFRHLPKVDERQQATLQGQQPSVQYTLDALTRFPGPLRPGIDIDWDSYKRTEMNVDRMIAAAVRLKEKEMARKKARENAKENVAVEH